MLFPEWLSIKISDLGKTQSEFSRENGFDKSHINKYIKGVQLPGASNIARLCYALSGEKPGETVSLKTMILSIEMIESIHNSTKAQNVIE